MVDTADVAVMIEEPPFDGFRVARYSIHDSEGVSGGQLMKFATTKEFTVTGGRLMENAAANEGMPFAGIAATSKVAGDGQTTIGVYPPHCGAVFDIKCSGAACVPVPGQPVGVSGGNVVGIISNKTQSTLSGGFLVGTAEEIASAQETIRVRLT